MGRLRTHFLDWLAGIRVPFHLKHWWWVRLAIFVVIDIVSISFAYWCAFALRLDDLVVSQRYAALIFSTMPFVVAIHLPVFFYLGMYRQVWRYANFNSAILIGKSVFVATTLAFAVSFLFTLDPLVPRSIPFLYWLVATAIIMIVRFSWRALASFQSDYRSGSHKRCLIYGAGSAGDILARHIKANAGFRYQIVGFIDDDQNKRRRMLHNLPIFGSGVELKKITKSKNVTDVLIAMPSASGQIIRRIVERCQEAGVRPLIMPDLTSTLTDEIQRPRPVDVADLLKRSPKATDRDLIDGFFRGQTVLITGAGGSIGAELARQVLRAKPRHLILFDSSEYNLYRIDLELRAIKQESTTISTVLGSVVDRRAVKCLFERHQPSLVLHAAAYKHVPMIESNPLEGIINNVLGTKVVAEASVQYGVKRFLLVSTDKAVRPTNIMGCTKRSCELLVQAMHAMHGNVCAFAAVRFGNVLGSSGSVIPRFMEQISAGGPVTVTHIEVTRYFMLTDEAVGLVLQSIAMSKGGEIFVLNMGEPVRIYDMAKQLILLAGKEPGKHIEIKITGLRPGEKLYEELILEGSEEQTLHDDVFVTTPKAFNAKVMMEQITRVIEAALANLEADAVEALRHLALPQGDAKTKNRAHELSREDARLH